MRVKSVVPVLFIASLCVVSCSNKQFDPADQLPILKPGTLKDGVTNPVPLKTIPVRLDVTSPDGKFVELVLPVDSNNIRMTFEQLRNLKGTWELSGDRAVTSEHGASLEMDLDTAAPVVPLLGRTDGGALKISYGTHSENVDLHADKYDWKSYTLKKEGE